MVIPGLVWLRDGRKSVRPRQKVILVSWGVDRDSRREQRLQYIPVIDQQAVKLEEGVESN